MNITIVKGHVTTWEIKETEKGFYATAKGSNIGKTYKTKEQARKAIRIAKDNYLKKHPETKIANPDIWATHGVLWVSDFDGNYYSD